jgi:hypothetical protein
MAKINEAVRFDEEKMRADFTSDLTADGIYDARTLLILEEIVQFYEESDIHLSDLDDVQALELRKAAVKLLETLYSIGGCNNSRPINKDRVVEITETIFYDYSINEFFYLPKGLEG